jgi:HAD superfamily hydrolase (TIGR01549 family)
MYKTVIFDIDGTLIDTEHAVLSSLQKMLNDDYGKYYTFEELHFVLGIPGAQSLPQLGISDIASANERWNVYMKGFFWSVKVFDGVAEVLSSLADHKVCTGIVTSKTREELRSDFIPFGLMKYLSFIVCADDTDEHKPNPKPILKFLEIANAEPKTSVYIGDTDYDFQCARSAGIDFGLALWGSKTPDVMAQHKLAKPADIIQLILKERWGSSHSEWFMNRNDI